MFKTLYRATNKAILIKNSMYIMCCICYNNVGIFVQKK